MIDAVEVAGEAAVEPPSTFVLIGAVAHEQVVVGVLRAERHVVVVTQ